MTADEIRNIVETVDPDPNRPEEATIREMRRVGHSSSQFVLIREIAAQLAELNAKTAFLETASKLERIASALEGLERR